MPISTTVINLLTTGELSGKRFSLIQPPQDSPSYGLAQINETTGQITIDAASRPAGPNYFVTVLVSDTAGNPLSAPQTIPVVITSLDDFIIKESSFTLEADLSQALAPYIFNLTADKGSYPYTWSLVSSQLPGVTLAGSGTGDSIGLLSLPRVQYGDYYIDLKVVDGGGREANTRFKFSLRSSKPHKLSDGRVEVDLYGSSFLKDSLYPINLTVADQNSTKKSITSSFRVTAPISNPLIQGRGINRLLTSSDTGTFNIPLSGDLNSFSYRAASFPSLLGMQATFDPTTQTNNLVGPPTSFGCGRITASDPLSQGTSAVGFTRRTLTAAAIVGSLSNWGIENIVSLPTLLLGEFYQINPLKPWPNAANWVKRPGWVVKVADTSVLPLGMSLDSNTGLLYGKILDNSVRRSILQYFEGEAPKGEILVEWNILKSDFRTVLDFPQVLKMGVKSIGTLTSSSKLVSCTSLNPLPGFVSTVVDNVATIEWTPDSAGEYDLWLDSVAEDGSHSFVNQKCISIFQSPLIISTQSLKSVVTDQNYLVALTGSGGSGQLTWSCPGPNYPPQGITVGPNGIISGITTLTEGEYQPQLIKFRLTDSLGAFVEKSLNLQINNNLEIKTTVLPVMKSGSFYSFALEGRGGVGSYTWSLDPSSPALPSGFQLSTSGVLSGTGPISFDTVLIFNLTDGVSSPVTKSLRLYVNNGAGILPITPQLVPVKRGCAYQGTLKTSGGSPVYKWSVSPSLPAGLELTADTTNSGVAYILGSTTQSWPINSIFKITVVDSLGSIGTLDISLESKSSMAHNYTVVNSDGYAVALPTAAVGEVYSQTLITTSCNSPVTWSIAAGTLPSGLTLTSAGVLAGTPTAVYSQTWNPTGNGYLTLKATDGAGDSLNIPLPMRVMAGVPKVTNTTLPEAILGKPYKVQLTAVNGDGLYTFYLDATSQQLPSGFYIQNNNGAPAYLMCDTVNSLFPLTKLVFVARDNKGLGFLGIPSTQLSLSSTSTFTTKTGIDHVTNTNTNTKVLGNYVDAPLGNSVQDIVVNPHRTFQFCATGLIHLPTDPPDFTTWSKSFTATSNVTGVTQ
jgi:hypothetical protein